MKYIKLVYTNIFVGMKTYVKPQTFMKSHKPIHKPKTYAEQLQTLQPHKSKLLFNVIVENGVI